MKASSCLLFAIGGIQILGINGNPIYENHLEKDSTSLELGSKSFFDTTENIELDKRQSSQTPTDNLACLPELVTTADACNNFCQVLYNSLVTAYRGTSGFDEDNLSICSAASGELKNDRVNGYIRPLRTCRQCGKNTNTAGYRKVNNVFRDCKATKFDDYLEYQVCEGCVDRTIAADYINPSSCGTACQTLIDSTDNYVFSPESTNWKSSNCWALGTNVLRLSACRECPQLTAAMRQKINGYSANCDLVQSSPWLTVCPAVLSTTSTSTTTTTTSTTSTSTSTTISIFTSTSISSSTTSSTSSAGPTAPTIPDTGCLPEMVNTPDACDSFCQILYNGLVRDYRGTPEYDEANLSVCFTTSGELKNNEVLNFARPLRVCRQCGKDTNTDAYKKVDNIFRDCNAIKFDDFSEIKQCEGCVDRTDADKYIDPATCRASCQTLIDRTDNYVFDTTGSAYWKSSNCWGLFTNVPMLSACRECSELTAAMRQKINGYSSACDLIEKAPWMEVCPAVSSSTTLTSTSTSDSSIILTSTSASITSTTSISTSSTTTSSTSAGPTAPTIPDTGCLPEIVNTPEACNSFCEILYNGLVRDYRGTPEYDEANLSVCFTTSGELKNNEVLNFARPLRVCRQCGKDTNSAGYKKVNNVFRDCGALNFDDFSEIKQCEGCVDRTAAADYIDPATCRASCQTLIDRTDNYVFDTTGSAYWKSSNCWGLFTNVPMLSACRECSELTAAMRQKINGYSSACDLIEKAPWMEVCPAVSSSTTSTSTTTTTTSTTSTSTSTSTTISIFTSTSISSSTTSSTSSAGPTSPAIPDTGCLPEIVNTPEACNSFCQILYNGLVREYRGTPEFDEDNLSICLVASGELKNNRVTAFTRPLRVCRQCGKDTNTAGYKKVDDIFRDCNAIKFDDFSVIKQCEGCVDRTDADKYIDPATCRASCQTLIDRTDNYVFDTTGSAYWKSSNCWGLFTNVPMLSACRECPQLTAAMQQKIDGYSTNCDLIQKAPWMDVCPAMSLSTTLTSTFTSTTLLTTSTTTASTTPISTSIAVSTSITISSSISTSISTTATSSTSSAGPTSPAIPDTGCLPEIVNTPEACNSFCQILYNGLVREYRGTPEFDEDNLSICLVASGELKNNRVTAFTRPLRVCRQCGKDTNTAGYKKVDDIFRDCNAIKFDDFSVIKQCEGCVDRTDADKYIDPATCRASCQTLIDRTDNYVFDTTGSAYWKSSNCWGLFTNVPMLSACRECPQLTAAMRQKINGYSSACDLIQTAPWMDVCPADLTSTSSDSWSTEISTTTSAIDSKTTSYSYDTQSSATSNLPNSQSSPTSDSHSTQDSALSSASSVTSSPSTSTSSSISGINSNTDTGASSALSSITSNTGTLTISSITNAASSTTALASSTGSETSVPITTTIDTESSGSTTTTNPVSSNDLSESTSGSLSEESSTVSISESTTIETSSTAAGVTPPSQSSAMSSHSITLTTTPHFTFTNSSTSVFTSASALPSIPENCRDYCSYVATQIEGASNDLVQQCSVLRSIDTQLVANCVRCVEAYPDLEVTYLPAITVLDTLDSCGMSLPTNRYLAIPIPGTSVDSSGTMSYSSVSATASADESSILTLTTTGPSSTQVSVSSFNTNISEETVSSSDSGSQLSTSAEPSGLTSSSEAKPSTSQSSVSDSVSFSSEFDSESSSDSTSMSTSVIHTSAVPTTTQLPYTTAQCNKYCIYIDQKQDNLPQTERCSNLESIDDQIVSNCLRCVESYTDLNTPSEPAGKLLDELSYCNIAPIYRAYKEVELPQSPTDTSDHNTTSDISKPTTSVGDGASQGSKSDGPVQTSTVNSDKPVNSASGQTSDLYSQTAMSSNTKSYPAETQFVTETCSSSSDSKISGHTLDSFSQTAVSTYTKSYPGGTQFVTETCSSSSDSKTIGQPQATNSSNDGEDGQIISQPQPTSSNGNGQALPKPHETQQNSTPDSNNHTGSQPDTDSSGKNGSSAPTGGDGLENQNSASPSQGGGQESHKPDDQDESNTGNGTNNGSKTESDQSNQSNQPHQSDQSDQSDQSNAGSPESSTQNEEKLGNNQPSDSSSSGSQSSNGNEVLNENKNDLAPGSSNGNGDIPQVSANGDNTSVNQVNSAVSLSFHSTFSCLVALAIITFV